MRRARTSAPNKKKFDHLARVQASDLCGGKPLPATYVDYADTNFRYLRATGLFQRVGRGIAIMPEKRTLATLIADEPAPPLDVTTYLRELCNGASLPTDNETDARKVLTALVQSATNRGIEIPAGVNTLKTVPDIEQARYTIEELIAHDKEATFAHDQPQQREEISAYLEMLEHRKGARRFLSDGVTEIELPHNEMPAYFEWILWRAFLSTGKLVNPPNKARRFKIDQDFLPVGTAPGGGPDLIFEFDDYVLVVEVTLTESSRQEAAEGSPVRLHVANAAQAYADAEKPVFGLFIARNIDSNAAESFRIGAWYLKDDTRVTVNIVPFTLAQFRHVFDTSLAPNTMRQLLQTCLDLRTHVDGAPAWKSSIAALVPAEASPSTPVHQMHAVRN